MSEFSENFLASRSLSTARAAAVARFIDDLEAWCAPRSLDCLDASDLRAFLDAKLAAGFHPNTVRKWLGMARTLASWMYEQRAISADTVLAIRAVRPPAGSSKRPQPQPYTRAELCELWALLDERWPRMTDEQASHYAVKWREGGTSYRRIRRHAIRSQLEAVIALALELCLRRGEIFALDRICVHPDGAYVVVWGREGLCTERARGVPFTVSARTAIYNWLEYRALLGVDHERPWVALHGGPTVGEPMKRDAFDALLRTYLGDGWTLKRLRDTGAVTWIKTGMGLEHLRQLLGQSAIEDTLPFARLVGGDLERRVHRLESRMSLDLAA